MRSTHARADFLSACKVSDTRKRALEEIRERGAEIVTAMFRLLKNALLYASDNRAMQLTIHETHGVVTSLAKAFGGYVSITYVDGTFFVCGQLLRASRSVYECAIEVSKLLQTCGVSELGFAAELTEGELGQLCDAFVTASRDSHLHAHLLDAELNHVVVRAVDSSLRNERDGGANLPALELSLRAFALALVVMRQGFERVSHGEDMRPQRLKRIAQHLVAVADRDEDAFVALITLANAHRDDAGRAVQAAILAIAVARRLTRDHTVLAQFAMAALMADVGRSRAAGPKGHELVSLSEEAERGIPALTSALCIASGGVNEQSALRTVTTFEATHLERYALLGALYKRAMPPLLQSKILHAVRALLAMVAPRDAAQPLSMVDALAQLARVPGVDEIVLKLLVQVLGVLPTGTVLEFETGEWGVVVGPSANRAAIARPRIKLVTDRAGLVFANPIEIDLGAGGPGRRFPAIAAIVEPDTARFNLTSVLLQGAAGGDAPAA